MKSTFHWYAALSSFLQVVGGTDIGVSRGIEDTQSVYASVAVEEIVQASGTGDSMAILLTDRDLRSVMISRISEKLQMNGGLAQFKVPADQITASIVDLRKLFMTSNSPFLIMVSDDRDFLAPGLISCFHNKYLGWTTRLLVVTRLSLSEIHGAKETLSKANGMVLSPAGSELDARWSVSVYLPYSLRHVRIASWSPRKRLVYDGSLDLFPDKFGRLIDGGHITATTVVYPPHTLAKGAYKNYNPDPNIPVSGPAVEFFQVLAQYMNFTYTVSLPPVIAFGYLFPNGTWGGMVGQLARKERDVGLQLFSFTYQRSKAVDYATPMRVDFARMLARKGETEIDPWGFFFPLTTSVWMSFLFSLVLVMTASFVLSTCLSNTIEDSVHYALDNYVRIFLGQDVKSPSGNYWWRSFVVGSWIITVLILMKGYTGNLSSLLIVRYVPQPHHTVRAVVDDPGATVVMSKGGSIEQTLNSFDSGVFKELADAGKKGKISWTKFTHYYDLVKTEMSKRPSHVIVTEGLPLKVLSTRHFSETGECLFYLSREAFFSQILAMPVQKQNPLRYGINKWIPRLVESGIYNYWLGKVFTNSTPCSKVPSKILVETSLSFNNVWGMFVTLASGYGIALIVFLLETATHVLH